jgi:hypothetical protein
VHAVLTQRLVGLAGSHQVRDEALPLLGPVLQAAQAQSGHCTAPQQLTRTGVVQHCAKV